jgi:16S rRNA A1518/A1519 N6-dimethyltransferase RsmA/KsgA/DIM1 with predicted DNA glycosylase/AP lyase activity
VEKSLTQTQIDVNMRGEKLSIERFCELAGVLAKNQEG